MALIKYDPESGKPPLWEDILRFSKNKYFLAILLVFVGFLGIFLPVIPGFLLFAFAFALLRKGTMAKIRKRLRNRRKP